MNDNMKKNISLEGNIKFFADATYKFTAPRSSDMKSFIIVVYNEKINNTLLCALCLLFITKI